MIFSRHRVNTIQDLLETPAEYGVELDIRSRNGKLIINHEPFQGGEDLEEYLSHFDHAFAMLDIKEEGLERKVMSLAEEYRINEYFLLGVTPPFMVKYAGEGITKMAVRFSEYESMETCMNFAGKVDWAWVDTFTKLPLDKATHAKLSKHFKIALVCPERWGRPHDIPQYISKMKKDNIKPDMVMSALEYIEIWKRW